MNCKPGDMAVIVSCSPGHEEALGHICTILDRDDHPLTGEPGWRFEPTMVVRGVERDCTLDCHLQPIRGPRPATTVRTVLALPVRDMVTA